jgi:hypothetical protein
VNTDVSYQRRTDQTIAEPADPAVTALADSLLAIYGDPSRGPAREAGTVTASQRSIAWVRPSELPTMVGAGWLRRGTDLQAEMGRRARRAPATATFRARRRITRTAIGRPRPATPTWEGPSR